MNERTLELVRKEAERCYPHEACGLFVAKGKRVRAIACRNVATDPRDRFKIAPEDYAAAADEGEVVGVWHSHVNCSPQPSEADRYGCDVSEVPWTIIALSKNEAGDFVLQGPVVIVPSGERPSLIGRPYLYGIYDCYTLVRDYYREELGVSLGDYSHAPNGWWSGGGNWFVENFEREGFVQLPPDSEFKKGDLLFIQTHPTTTNHAAVYIGDDMILHHCVDRLSRRDIYGGYWHRHTTHHLRHKTQC